jgi:hypothetical protein
MARFKRDDEFMEDRAERQVLASPNFKKAPPPDAQNDGHAQVVPELVEEPSAQVHDAYDDGNMEIDGGVGPSVPADGGGVAEQEIEPVEPLDPVSAEPEPTQDIRDLQIRFFQLLDDERRLAAFVAFGIIRNAQGRMDHAMERRLFRRAVRQGRAEEIEQMLVAAEIERKGETA